MSEAGSSSNSVEANRQNFNIDGREEKRVFNKPMAYFCMNGEMADVEFVFYHQNKITKIPAHTFALRPASEVFRTGLACYENVTEKRPRVLQTVGVTDARVKIDAFKITLLFIYNEYKNVELTGESVLAVLYIAMKYMIKQLETLCINYLLNNLNAENVFTVLQFCIDYQTDSRLTNGCKKIIQRQTEAVIKAESFTQISHRCLTLLLEQECLDIEEVRLFEAIVGWAKAECEKSGDDPNDGKNIRSKLGRALHLIRFPAMTTKEFADSVAPTGILTAEERVDMLYMIGGANPVGTPISTISTPRRQNEFHLVPMDVIGKKFTLFIRIEHFPALVTSKRVFSTRYISFNDTRLFISLPLLKYCQTSGKHFIPKLDSSDQPETLGAYIHGSRAHVERYSSFDVTAQFKFIQAPTGSDHLTHRFCLNSSNGYKYSYGNSNLATIEDLLNPQNGYLVDNALGLLAYVVITEIEREQIKS